MGSMRLRWDAYRPAFKIVRRVITDKRRCATFGLVRFAPLRRSSEPLALNARRESLNCFSAMPVLKGDVEADAERITAAPVSLCHPALLLIAKWALPRRTGSLSSGLTGGSAWRAAPTR